MTNKHIVFQNLVVVTTVGSIRALNGVPGDTAVVASAEVHGSYWFDFSDTTTGDDNRTCIVATDGGRWKLVVLDADAVEYQPGSASAYRDGSVGAELAYLATQTGSLAASIALLMVANFYGGATSDDALALQTFAHLNQGKRIVLHSSTFSLDFYSKCTITDSGGTYIDGNNLTVIQHTADMTSFTFQPTTAGTTNAFLPGGGMGDITISHTSIAASSTTGYGLEAIQCSGIRFRNVTVNNADTRIAGCQLWRMNGPSFFATVGAGRGIDSALVQIDEAPWGSGNYQKNFTGVIDQWNSSANQLRGALIRVYACDGLVIGSGNGNSASRALVNVKAGRNGSYVSDLTIAPGAYLDCGPLGGAPFGVLISADGFASSYVYSVNIDAWIANGSISGVAIRKAEVQAVTLRGTIANFTSYAIDQDATGSILDLTVVSMQFQNNGSNGSSGDVRLNHGHSLNIGPNIHTNSLNVCLSITGSWSAGEVTPGVNATGVAADIAYSSATFVSPMVLNQGASTYVGVLANSWKNRTVSLNTFANDAAAAAAGLQIGREYNDAAGGMHRRMV